MSPISRAFQQLDPLGALIGRPMTYIAAIGMPVYASVMTWLNREDIAHASLALLALLVVTAASAVLIRQSSPLRAPFTGRVHAVVSGATLLAYGLGVASTWEQNDYIRDDGGSVVIGVALLAMSQYRPPKEIAATGLVFALIIGVVSLGQAQSLATTFPPISVAIIAMYPVLAMSLAAATFGRFLIDGLLFWRRRARRAADAVAGDTANWIVRSVQQDRVTILNQEIVPFFAEVLQAGTITESQRDRARRISDDVRTIMVAEVDRTWLDPIVDQIGGALIDPGRLAPGMSTDQRTAVRAFLIALSGHSAAHAGAVTVNIRPQGGASQAVIAAELNGAESVVREFAPYIAVMRIVFTKLKVEFTEGRIALRFSYDQR